MPGNPVADMEVAMTMSKVLHGPVAALIGLILCLALLAAVILGMA